VDYDAIAPGYDADAYRGKAPIPERDLARDPDALVDDEIAYAKVRATRR